MLSINNVDIFLVSFILILFGSLELASGLYGKKSLRNKNDWYVELISSFQLLVLMKPIIFTSTTVILYKLFPEYFGRFSTVSLYLSTFLIIIGDDFLQYWYHRAAHSWNWLWRLHRPHHVAREMGVLVSYRNALLYYILMPNIWWLSIANYLGFYQQVIIAVVLKQLIVTGAHSDIRWDSFLYKHKFLNPLAWFLERLISTPATHFSHHGQDTKDGISNPNGNFGNMFFIWDMIFKTALITRKYPKKFGIINDPNDSWSSHIYYPIIKSNKIGSEISN